MQPADPQRYSEAPPAPDTASVLPREVQSYIDTLTSTAEGAVASRRAAATADVVAGLTDDEDIRKGAALLPLLEARLIDDASATARALRNDVPQLSEDARRLLGRMSQLSEQFTEEDMQKLKLAIDRYSAAGEKLDALAARGDRLLAQIEAGEGTLGQIQQDPQLYQDVKALVEDLRKHPWKILWKD